MSARSDLQAQQDSLVLAAFTDAVPRETREVATATGLGMKAARHALLRLEAARKVARLGGTGTGFPWAWRRLAPRPDSP